MTVGLLSISKMGIGARKEVNPMSGHARGRSLKRNDCHQIGRPSATELPLIHRTRPGLEIGASGTPEVSEAVESVPEPAEDFIEDVPAPAERDPVDALAESIIKSLDVSGRGQQGNLALCESEAVLRDLLRSDEVVWDESDIPAALTKLETATVPGFERARLVRGYALHRSIPITSKTLPPRAMQLNTLHFMDLTAYEPADIEPYVV